MLTSIRCLLLIVITISLHIKTIKTTELEAVTNGWINGKDCNRICNGVPKQCYFNFKIENVVSMSKACYDCPKIKEDCFRKDCIIGGGGRRTLTVINRQLPGPPIEICKGDKVRVVVQNSLQSGEPSSIHWHGLFMNKGKEPYMDGVPFISQCPIVSGTSFIYEFVVDHAGTFFWHSHFKLQKGEGLFGALIVREPETKSETKAYDFDLSEHVIFLGDWNDKDRFSIFNEFRMGPIPSISTSGLLINGLGYQNSDADRKLPLANFTVKQGFKYRFRIISSGFADCPFTFSIDNHNLSVIATDGFNIQPINVTSITIHDGERYDFVLFANQEIATYWIRVKGHITCESKKVFAKGYLHYEGAKKNTPGNSPPSYETAINPGKQLNPLDYKRDEKVVNIDQLRSIKSMNPVLKTKTPSKLFYLSFEMNLVNVPGVNEEGYYGNEQVKLNFQRGAAQINHISNKISSPPMLPNRNKNNKSEYCNFENTQDKNCTMKYCECPHVLTIKKNEVVEIVLIDKSNNNTKARHPVHIHGYAVHILGMGRTGNNNSRDLIMQMDKDGLLKRNFENPPLKDTVYLPSGGYVIFRFLADNPGYWLIHCHVAYHAEEGMHLVLQVGEPGEMPSEPRDFPKCNSFLGI